MFKPDETVRKKILAIRPGPYSDFTDYLKIIFFFLTCSKLSPNKQHTLHFVSLVPFNLEQPPLNFLFFIMPAT